MFPASSFTVIFVPCSAPLPITPPRLLRRFVAWCRAYVPPSVRADLDAIRDDDAAVKEYGERLAVATIRELHAAGVRAVHFFTLNLTGSVQVSCVSTILHCCSCILSSLRQPLAFLHSAFSHL